jgi:F-type H+-transporting ATPase subunit gamma
MPTLLDFRRRIRSVKNTQQITRAMKFVAAARLRRAQEKLFAARPYAQEMLVLLRSTMARVENPAHPLMVRRPEERLLLLVLSSDRGLCGAFNTNVIRRAVEFLREHKEKTIEMIPIGKKARDALSKRNGKFAAEYINVSTRVEFSQAREIAAQVMERYTAADTDAVYALYNEFRSVLTQRLTLEKLLPIEPARWDAPAIATSGGGESGLPGADPVTLVDYLYEQPPAQIFGRLLPRFVETQVFRAVLESSAAEHAARMTAMDSATNNAAELMDQLTLHMNKVRQATITKEIIEVVSGATWTA